MTCYKFAAVVRDRLAALLTEGRDDVARDAVEASNAVDLALRGHVYPAMGIAASLAHKYQMGEAFQPRRSSS